MPADRYLIVGLGNPGPTYAGNRHNIGFMAIDAIAARHGFAPFRAKFRAHLADGVLAGRPVMLLKPMTFMNVSGQAVAAAASFFKIPPGDIVVFHDEIDLATGKVRLKVGGGHAGHNGLRSIHAHIGPDYARVRLGVGRPRTSGDVADHVLDDFAKADKVWLEPLLDALAAYAPLLVGGDGQAFMSKVALAVRPPKREREPGQGDGRTSADGAGPDSPGRTGAGRENEA
ncbi:MAG: aminoacyl-tRNA hydrolase [Rhodospirillales bacterium]|nr:aminoacyl-tRNA hydrolase [Rhodospirillales bacterium]